jgi:hypothetical protein
MSRGAPGCAADSLRVGLPVDASMEVWMRIFALLPQSMTAAHGEGHACTS